MNFLQLCQRLARETGTVAGVPSMTTLAGATGRIAQVKDWIAQAYIDIQNERTDWRWMRLPFLKQLTIGQIEYAPADWNLPVARWIGDTPGQRAITIYEDGKQEQEGEIEQIEWPEFRRRYVIGVHDANQPTAWAITPQGKIAFGNKPDKAYWVRGEYRCKAQVLQADADTPDMPEQHHMLIVSEAVRLMSRRDEAWQSLGAEGLEYDRLRNALVNDQTPELVVG